MTFLSRECMTLKHNPVHVDSKIFLTHEELVAAGKALRGFRKDKGWSQSELAKRAGIAQETISRVESGSRTLSAQHVRGLCDALGVSFKELLASLGPQEEECLYQFLQGVVFLLDQNPDSIDICLEEFLDLLHMRRSDFAGPGAQKPANIKLQPWQFRKVVQLTGLEPSTIVETGKRIGAANNDESWSEEVERLGGLLAQVGINFEPDEEDLERERVRNIDWVALGFPAPVPVKDPRGPRERVPAGRSTPEAQPPQSEQPQPVDPTLAFLQAAEARAEERHRELLAAIARLVEQNKVVEFPARAQEQVQAGPGPLAARSAKPLRKRGPK